jgi:hypothetical protein
MSPRRFLKCTNTDNNVETLLVKEMNPSNIENEEVIVLTNREGTSNRKLFVRV